MLNLFFLQSALKAFRSIGSSPNAVVESIEVAIGLYTELVICFSVYELDIKIIGCQVKNTIVEYDVQFLTFIYYANTGMSVF